ncbi:MAG: hypothetical protein JXA60_02160 [Candidatus Coatesbacteria bacterium]|nr:hypothetical protein [Candidatus Coatesbacteria bacterium]
MKETKVKNKWNSIYSIILYMTFLENGETLDFSVDKNNAFYGCKAKLIQGEGL